VRRVSEPKHEARREQRASSGCHNLKFHRCGCGRRTVIRLIVENLAQFISIVESSWQGIKRCGYDELVTVGSQYNPEHRNPT
jgi:hypothetical protein